MNQRLITARKSLGWTMERAAQNLLISLSHYSKLERGTRKPGIHLARAINNIFYSNVYEVTQDGVNVKEDMKQ